MRTSFALRSAQIAMASYLAMSVGLGITYIPSYTVSPIDLLFQKKEHMREKTLIPTCFCPNSTPKTVLELRGSCSMLDTLTGVSFQLPFTLWDGKVH